MAIVIVLLALVALRLTVVLVGAALLIHPVRACPACGRETVEIRQRWLARLTRTYQWRWCPSCGWQGPARREGRFSG